MRVLAGVLSTLLLVTWAAVVPAAPSHAPAPEARVASAPVSAPAALPLAGRTVVLDPGHQLGNAEFRWRIARPVPACGMTKPCNTEGASTNAGYPEPTLTFAIAQLVRGQLEARGARVVLTRATDDAGHWGPCVDARGRSGNGTADLKLSIHADGHYDGGPGFHVIVPPDRPPWTADIHEASRRLAVGVRTEMVARGLPVAAYVAGGRGIDVRADLATLNLSDIPTALVELGNMRDPGDARRMTTAAGRATYAAALAAAIERYFS